jgi:hypothetical protein
MANPVERWRASLERGGQERRDMLMKHQTSEMRRLELLERVATALGDVLSARLAELGPVKVVIVSGSEGVSDIHLSADSRVSSTSMRIGSHFDLPLLEGSDRGSFCPAGEKASGEFRPVEMLPVAAP